MKKTAIIASLAATAIILSGCSGTDEAVTPAENAEPITLTIGHAGSETDPRQTASLRFKELVEEASGGDITVEIYPAATLGTWEEMIEGLQLGTVDIVIESLLAFESYTDLSSIETAPFLYDDYDQFSTVWNGDLGGEIKTAIKDASGYEMLGNLYRGPRELTTKEEVTSLDDLAGLTIRTPSAPTMLATWEALGARAEALPFNEVYSALESGVIDGQENPLDAILFNSIHEVAPYIAETDHMYANYHFIMWGDTLAGLPQSYQDIINEATTTVGEEYTETTLADIEDYTAQLEEGGAIFTKITDRPKWVEATQPIIDGLPDQVKAWVDEIRG